MNYTLWKLNACVVNEMAKSKKQTIVMNIGTSSMLVILIGLSFAILAVLAVSSARNDYRLSEELALHTKGYYEASNLAWEKLADTDTLYEQRDEDNISSFTIGVNEYQELQVDIYFPGESDEYDIIKWKVVNIGEWEGDTSLPVLKEP